MTALTRAGSAEIKVLSGNYSAAYGAKLSQVEVVAFYPITPATTMLEKVAEFAFKGELNAHVVMAEGEHSAMSILIGASMAGARCFSGSAGQGIAYMHETLQYAGRGRHPMVMVGCSRGLYVGGGGTSWHPDHEDSLTARDSGWVQLFCQSAQEVLDSVIMGYKIAETASLPVMPVQEGFFMSHAYEPVHLPDPEAVSSYLPKEPRRIRLDPEKPVQFGTADVSSFRSKYEHHLITSAALQVVKDANAEFKELFGRSWGVVDPYKCEDADVIFMVLGTLTDSCRVMVDRERDKGRKAGLLKVRLFSPFPKREIAEVLSVAKKVGIIQRGYSFGHGGHLALETKAAMYDAGLKAPVFEFVSGLGGTDIPLKVYHEAADYVYEHDCPEESVIWKGVPPR
jgi:pyruvate/2-oxoacid:ferredoxin oxidoreductase alpha subunit